MDDRTPTQFIESLESSAFTSFLTSLNDNNAAYVSITLPVACIDPLAALELIDDGEESFYWSHPKNEISISAGGNLIELRSTGKGRFHDIAAQTAHLKNVIQAYTAIEHVMAGPLFLGGYSFNDHNIGKLWKKFGAARFVLPEWMLLEIDGYHLLTLSFKKKNLTADVIYQEVISKITRFLNLAGELNSTRREQKESPSALCTLQTDADKARWYENIETAKSLIKKGKFEKIVLARSLDLQSESEIRPTLLSHHLRNAYPDCYNFLIRPDRHTSFVGATPERLASFKDGMVQTEGLAGTISRGKSALEDATLGRELLKSNKNLEEHKFVVRSIQDSLSVLSEHIEHPEQPGIKKFQNVQHLFTPIRAKIKKGVQIHDLIRKLHPTPAVGGYPKKESFRYIHEIEQLDRGWYAAPVGWFNLQGYGEFAVAIRSALLHKNKARLFAGCGIVKDSEPATEWNETLLKFRPLLGALNSIKPDHV